MLLSLVNAGVAVCCRCSSFVFVVLGLLDRVRCCLQWCVVVVCWRLYAVVGRKLLLLIDVAVCLVDVVCELSVVVVVVCCRCCCVPSLFAVVCCLL